MGAREKAVNEDRKGPRARPREALSLVSPEQRRHIATDEISGLRHGANRMLRGNSLGFFFIPSSFFSLSPPPNAWTSPSVFIIPYAWSSKQFDVQSSLALQ